MINLADKDIYFDVGANQGTDTARFATLPNSFVFAFEPNPILVRDLLTKFMYSENVLVVPLAVNDHTDIVSFNVSDRGDLGVGSLYDFHPELRNYEFGKHFMFATFSGRQMALTIRLDTFMALWGIDQITYLHIDAQGSDLAVIRSLGESIKKVKAGQCECTYKVPLYVDADKLNNYDDCMRYLDLCGFDSKISYIHANDTEVDISFVRRG